MNLSQLKYAEQYRNITLRCCMVLLVLRDGRKDFGKLACELDMPKAALSRTLDNLCHYGLVKRRRNDDDARMVTVWLTDKGANVAGVIYG